MLSIIYLSIYLSIYLFIYLSNHNDIFVSEGKITETTDKITEITDRVLSEPME